MSHVGCTHVVIAAALVAILFVMEQSTVLVEKTKRSAQKIFNWVSIECGLLDVHNVIEAYNIFLFCIFQDCSLWTMTCDRSCVSVTHQCDGIPDCADGKDEAYCGEVKATTKSIV